MKASERTRLAVIEKPYEAVAGIAAPRVVVGREDDVLPVALMGDEDLQVRGLLPDDGQLRLCGQHDDLSAGRGVEHG